MSEEDPVLSGFMNHDYILVFSVKDAAQRAELVALCSGPWQGDEITENTWEVSNELDPDAMESAVLELLSDGDRACYYYLTPPLPSGLPRLADSKRIFRVVIS